MKKFETPEIKVVMFKTNDVISTSTGYEGSPDGSEWSLSAGSAPQPLDYMPF